MKQPRKNERYCLYKMVLKVGFHTEFVYIDIYLLYSVPGHPVCF